jgi:hypothetical protein
MRNSAQTGLSAMFRPRLRPISPSIPSAAHLRHASFAAVSYRLLVYVALDPKLQLGIPRCRLHWDRARDRDLVAVVDHLLDVPHEKLPLCIEVGARLKARSRGRAELPDARVHKVLMERDCSAATSSVFSRASRSRSLSRMRFAVTYSSPAICSAA